MHSEIYLALIGDVVGSRTLPDREDAQRKLIEILDHLNGPESEHGFREQLAAPLTLTAGDEIQALLLMPSDPVGLVQRLTDHSWGRWTFPYLVFGVGIGSLSTGSIDASAEQAVNPALLDGECFHRARAALAKAGRSRNWVRWNPAGLRCAGALNALFELMAAIRSGWTTTQAIISHQARLADKQKDIAIQRGVSPSVISESLRAAHYNAILAGEEAARELFAREVDSR